MKIKMLKIFLLQLLSFSVFGAEDYAVSKINPLLLEGSSAVKRYELVRFEIKNPGSAIYYYKTAITIIDENGDNYAEWQESYDDKFTAIRSVNATLFDANGKKIRSLKKAEISDVSGSGSSLVADNRLKIHNFYCKIYPYTVEYEVEIKKEGLMFMPSWSPVKGGEYAVENSIFEIISPAGYKIRYKAVHYDQEPVVSGNKEITYHWEVKNLPAIEEEAFSPALLEITPSVFAAPTVFEIEGYKGVMSSWLELGKFQSRLNRNRDQLPENVKQAIHALTDTITNAKRKVALLYKYMQSNTRYISIQLGIGGWQPLEASFVANKGYGDCKALSNYMYSILKEAGIKSYYTLIQAGNNNNFYLPDFPSRQSNHAIISVPLEKDTIWLECTDQTLPAGYLSGFTSNRYALMIKDDGGYLVHTPDYNCKDNLQIRKINAMLDEEGKLVADIATSYTGMQQDKLFNIINTYSKKEQLDFLKKQISLPSYDINAFNYKIFSTQIPKIEEKLNLEAYNYAQVSRKRIFIQPNLLSKTNLKLTDEERINDIEFKMGFCDRDSVEIKIPAGFTVEALPSAVDFTNQFGQYKIAYKVDENKIVMIRLFERKSGRFPATYYKELLKMYGAMYKADRGKIVLVKKDE